MIWVAIWHDGVGRRSGCTLAIGHDNDTTFGVIAAREHAGGFGCLTTEHAITIRPICFASQTLARLPPALQEAVKRAGREAGAFGREAESSEDGQKIAALEAAGRLRRVAFNDRAALKRAVDPVMEAYAKEVGAESIFARINALTS